MAQYLAPDVYVEEIDSGNHPIEGVSTSITGFVGMAAMGPSSGLPQLVTSFSQFTSLYGSYFDFGPTFLGYNGLPYAVEGFFNNLGSLLYIARVIPTGASVATGQTQGGVVTRLSSDTPTPTAAAYTFTPVSARGIQGGTQILLRMVKNGIVTDSKTLTVATVDPVTNLVTTDNPGSATTIYESKYTTLFTDNNLIDANGNIVSVAAPVTTRPASLNSFVISSANEGSWGLNVQITTAHESAARSPLDAFISGAVGNNQISLKSAAGFYANAWVEINRGKTKHYRKCLAVTGVVITLDGPAMAAADVAPDAGTTTYFSTCEFRLTVSYGPRIEVFPGLTLENVPGRYYVDAINNGSNLITVPAAGPLTATHPFFFPSGTDGARVPLTSGGSDGTAAPTDGTFIGTDLGPGKRTGIQALSDIEDISIVAAPGITSANVQGALIAHCETLRYRFAILDPAPKSGNKPPDLHDIQNQRDQFDTKYAAIYYPRVQIYDPSKDLQVIAPPSGHMAGIYARVDDQRGVFKAPANEVIAGITDYETLVNKADQEVLNPEPKNINVLRDFRKNGNGLRVYGARVITSDTNWKYINIRRLFIFLERSIEIGTQWAVFEPNDYRLWAKVTQSISGFLTRCWRDGALMGKTVEEAFFVKCDSTTMTHDDIENGRLICVVGVAPVYPAEFVIIRIGQWDGGSAVQELS
jgi:phage tail sheath protein FI